MEHLEHCPDQSQNIQAAYARGQQVRETREPQEVPFDDAPTTLAFWDGFYGRGISNAR